MSDTGLLGNANENDGKLRNGKEWWEKGGGQIASNFKSI